MKLIVDGSEGKLGELAKDALEIKVAVAFLTESGLGWLPADRYDCSEFVVGVNLGITTPGSLKLLADGGAWLRVFCDPGKLFHPKAVYVRRLDSEHLFIGSNNLTSGGLFSNYEIAVLLDRNKESETLFQEFLNHFQWLKIHQHAFEPDREFFESYTPSRVRQNLSRKLLPGSLRLKPKTGKPTPQLSTVNVRNLGDYLKLLAAEFPRLDRSVHRTIKDHKLKRFNDDVFRPLFQRIAESAWVEGRPKAKANLNIGGKWYRIPNLLIEDPHREPWERTREDGRAIIQIHYDENYANVSFSLVLQYNLTSGKNNSVMPETVLHRYRRISEYLMDGGVAVEEEMPPFLHWIFKKEFLWAKPIVSRTYAVRNLPSDEKLAGALEELSFYLSVVAAT